jgi:hypothetical protein
MSSEVAQQPALLNPHLKPGEPYLTNEQMRELWEAVTVDVHPDLAGQAVNRLDEMAAKGNRVARAVLFQLAVEGAMEVMARDRDADNVDAHAVRWAEVDDDGPHPERYGPGYGGAPF